MVRIYEEFLTKDNAENYRNEYNRKFSPTIYGTVLKRFRDRLSGHWVISGHRFLAVAETPSVS